MEAPSAAPWVMGVDLSTTACKAIVWSTSPSSESSGSGLIAEARAEFPLQNHAPGRWHQDAASWWRALGSACQQLRAQLGPQLQRVKALCLTHQRETYVVCDASGEALHPAVLWMDTESEPSVTRAKAELSAEYLHQTSGKYPCTTPSFYKLAQLFEQHPNLRTENIHDVHSYLMVRLIGRAVSSVASIDPMGLLDLKTGAYAPELLKFLGINRAQLPELVLPGSPIGTLTKSAAEFTGLPAGLLVIAGAGDGQTAALGAGAQATNEAYLNLGTALVSGVLSPNYQVDLAYRTLYAATPACDIPSGAAPPYLLETDLQGGSFTLDWLADRLLKIPAENYTSAPANTLKGEEPGNAEPQAPSGTTKQALLKALSARAESLAPGSEGLLLIPYWNGVMNPYWDPNARGTILGLQGHHEAHHLYRAILEGLAFEQRLHTERVEQSYQPIERLILLGGISQSALARQIFADILNKPLQLASTLEATCLGAGILAACGAGLFSSSSAAIQAMVRPGPVILPGPNAASYERLYAIYKEIYPSLKPSLSALAAFGRDPA